MLASCVSIDISKNESKKANGISYNSPSHGFEEISSESVDKGWRNPTNGNTITFLSDCQNLYDPTLIAIETGVVSGLQNLKLQSLKEKMYNGRASRQAMYSGEVDGIPSQISIMTFKKNGCIYVITYVAIAKNFSENREDFELFLQEFRAP